MKYNGNFHENSEFLQEDVLHEASLVSMRDNDKFRLYGKQSDDDFVKNYVPVLTSSAILKNCSFVTMLETLEYFRRLNFCENCSPSAICDIKNYTVDDKQILYVSVDTESG